MVLNNIFELLRWIMYGLEIYLLLDLIARLFLKDDVYTEVLMLTAFIGLIILIDLGVI